MVINHGEGEFLGSASSSQATLQRILDQEVSSLYSLSQLKQAVRVATRYAPPLSFPMGAQAPRAPPSRRNVAVVYRVQYVLTVTAAPASRVKAALSKTPFTPGPA